MKKAIILIALYMGAWGCRMTGGMNLVKGHIWAKTFKLTARSDYYDLLSRRGFKLTGDDHDLLRQGWLESVEAAQVEFEYLQRQRRGCSRNLAGPDPGALPHGAQAPYQAMAATNGKAAAGQNTAPGMESAKGRNHQGRKPGHLRIHDI